MSYTNSTPNLHLPQYIATDKPTYLGDWNASMQTIDTVITETQSSASGAQGTASSAMAAAQNAQASANSANSKADTNTADISEIKEAFNFNSISATVDSGWTALRSVQIVNSNWIKIIRFMISTHGNFSGTASVIENDTFIKLFSINSNIFSLAEGSLTSNYYGFSGCSYSAKRKTDQGTTSSGASILAFWDGGNTNFYMGLSTTNYQNLTNLSIFDNITYLPTGQVLNI